MKILLGTTNRSKAEMFLAYLRGTEAEMLTLSDLDLKAEPEEAGRTPEENAAIKARFYGKYYERVICGDSGLYLDGLPLDDARQPGLSVRSPQGKRLNDEEMTAYYAALAASLGGRVTACYLSAYAAYCAGKVYTCVETWEEALQGAFYLVDTPSPVKHPGWPLDSLSKDPATGLYFTERTVRQLTADNAVLEGRNLRVREFLINSFGL